MKNNFKLWSHLLLTTMLLWLMATTAQAQEPETQLFLELNFQDSGFLAVDIVLTNVSDLYGVELQLEYDPTQLAVQDGVSLLDGIQITPGPLFPTKDSQKVVVINRAKGGTIKYVTTLLNPAPPVSAKRGILANALFQVSNDSRPIEVKVVSIKLISANLTQIPVISHDLLLEGNTVATPQSTVTPNPTDDVEPIATSTPTTGSEGDIYFWIIIGIIGLIIFLPAVLFIRNRQLNNNTDPQPRKMPGANITTGRSSTLLTQQGHDAAAQGKVEIAYEYFSQAIELDPANAEAWLGKGLVAQQASEKRICLQRALSLDPDNEQAKTALEQL